MGGYSFLVSLGGYSIPPCQGRTFWDSKPSILKAKQTILEFFSRKVMFHHQDHLTKEVTFNFEVDDMLKCILVQVYRWTGSVGRLKSHKFLRQQQVLLCDCLEFLTMQL